MKDDFDSELTEFWKVWMFGASVGFIAGVVVCLIIGLMIPL